MTQQDKSMIRAGLRFVGMQFKTIYIFVAESPKC